MITKLILPAVLAVALCISGSTAGAATPSANEAPAADTAPGKALDAKATAPAKSGSQAATPSGDSAVKRFRDKHPKPAFKKGVGPAETFEKQDAGN